MEIVSRGPVAVASLLWERGATRVLTVVCTATFELVPGKAVLQSNPEPPLENDVPWDAPYARSLRAPTDLVPVKANVDVLLTGHAYAPGGRPARSLLARLAVGSIDKTIEVFPDRYFDPAGTLVEGRPFTHMPLVYERAAGGPGTWNPVGVVVGQRDTYGNVSLPNLVPPRTPVLSPDRLLIAPVGLGPLRSDWPSRVQKLGGRSPRDLPTSWSGQSVPDDIARDYFNAAPADQQLENLRADESITLENLHASYPSLSCRLPGIRPTATLEGRSAPAMITLRCDTLRIDTDRGTCTLVWRAHVPLRQPQETGRLVVALDTPEHAKRHPTVVGAERESDGTETVAASLETTLTTPALGLAAALPFPPSAPSPPRPSAQSSSSWNAITSPPARDPLSQSASSWDTPAPRAPPPRAGAPEQSFAGTPFTGAAAPRAPASLREPSSTVAPPASLPPPLPFSAVAPPPPVAPPAVAQTPVPPPITAPSPSVESPWATSTSRRVPVSTRVDVAPALGAAVVAAAVAFRPDAAPPASQGSAIAASNAAADAEWNIRPGIYRPSAPQQPAVSAQPEVAEMIQLIWFDPPAVPRVRRQPAWKRILDALEDELPDADLDEAGSSEQPVETEDRREIFEVLARGEAIDDAGIQEALRSSVREGGKFASPIKLLAGELSFPFDELETLKATVATVTPLIGNDEQLKAAVTNAQDLLKLSDLRTSPAVVESLTLRIREVFAQGKRVVPASYLDTQVERALLEQRHYQRRAVFGGPHLRALLLPSGSSQPVPAYMPDALAQKLPLYLRFRARLIVEIHPQLDQYETSPMGLRVIALARAFPQPGASAG